RPRCATAPPAAPAPWSSCSPDAGAAARQTVGCAVMSSLTGARVAVAAAFFAQGFVFISLTTRLPRFLDRWGLDEVALSGLLLMMVLLAGVGSLVAEHAARRTGSAVLL